MDSQKRIHWIDIAAKFVSALMVVYLVVTIGWATTRVFEAAIERQSQPVDMGKGVPEPGEKFVCSGWEGKNHRCTFSKFSSELILLELYWVMAAPFLPLAWLQADVLTP